MFSTRTLISLGQFLALQLQGDLVLFLEKCGFGKTQLRSGDTAPQTYNLLRTSDSSHVNELLDEICRSTRMLRAAVNPKYLYNERWIDLERCLLLDGYRIAEDYSRGYTVIATDPTIAAVVPLDDDLSIELNQSNLVDRQEILRLIENSA